MDWLYRNIPVLGLLLICLIGGRRIVTGTPSFSRAYDRLPAEEKSRYDPHKIRRLGVVWLGTVAALILLLLPADGILLWILAGCLAADLLAYPLLADSLWALDRFCRADKGR